MQPLLRFMTLIIVAVAAMSLAMSEEGLPALVRLPVLLIGVGVGVGVGGGWLSFARLVVRQRAR